MQPYRLVFDASTCILCGHERGRKAKARDTCKCFSMSYCKSCKADDEYVGLLLVTFAVCLIVIVIVINRFL